MPKLEHENLAKNIRTKMGMSEMHIMVKGDYLLTRYCGILRSVQDIIKVLDERSASHTDTLRQLQLFFKNELIVKPVLQLAGWSEDKIGVAEAENALETKEKKLQTLPGLAAESATLRTDTSRLRGLAETLTGDSLEMVMLTQIVRSLAADSQKSRADAEALKKWNRELTGKVRDQCACYSKACLAKSRNRNVSQCQAEAACKTGGKG